MKIGFPYYFHEVPYYFHGKDFEKNSSEYFTIFPHKIQQLQNEHDMKNYQAKSFCWKPCSYNYFL
jgi:hypothetical protein